MDRPSVDRGWGATAVDGGPYPCPTRSVGGLGAEGRVEVVRSGRNPRSVREARAGVTEVELTGTASGGAT